jgi:hypothetical protein
VIAAFAQLDNHAEPLAAPKGHRDKTPYIFGSNV